MSRKLSILLQAIIFFVFASCKHTGNKTIENNRIIAYIDTIPITIDQIDRIIDQEIYDELNRIFLIRKIALNETIKNRLLMLEASKHYITVTKLIDSIYLVAKRNGSLQKFIEINNFNKGIPSLERSLKYYDINTIKGEEVLIKRFKESLISHFTDSLKTIYKTTILLSPPVPPTIKIENLKVHYKGNSKSKVTFLVISDFECEMCREFNYIFDSLYSKYRENIRFAYTNFGSYATISAIASESAARQGKFWEMHDSLFSLKNLPDTNDIFKIATNLKINIDEFKRDFYDETIKTNIENNLHILINSGIYATPTIMINNKPVFNSSSIKEIEQLLLNTLSTQNQI